MRERPIIFNTRDVLAILDGRKKQVRRVLPKVYVQRLDPPRGDVDIEAGYPFVCGLDGNDECISAVHLCPFGQPGDRLWVRETWAHWQKSMCFPLNGFRQDPEISYRATDHEPDIDVELVEKFRWRSPVSMPRWASRILLEITEVRVQPLRDMGKDDAIAEGWPIDVWGDKWFASIWNSTAKPGTRWEDNPWVWAVSFKRVQP